MKLNIKSFRKLIKRYETITLEEIKAAFKKHPKHLVAKQLTGFSGSDSCTLCIEDRMLAVVDPENSFLCSHCLYSNNKGSLHCIAGKAQKTYIRIQSSRTPVTLHNAYRARAKFMHTVLQDLNLN